MNYYNENDPKAAAWLRELIHEGHISNGVVDERSIVEVLPTDLHGYNQCHFFAGIGGWSYALRLAGIPDDEPIWTGSCPCQPFSAAGKQLGTADARHLWPEFSRLIGQCQPSVVFGEQVASKAGREWLSGVFADLENMAYAVAGADLCAAGLGAPHIRQRLYWVADSTGARHHGPERQPESKTWNEARMQLSRSGGEAGGLAHTDGWQCGNGELQCSGEHGQQQEDGGTDRLEYSTSNGREQRGSESNRRSVASGCGVGGMGNPSLPASARLGPQRQQLHGSSAWSPATALRCTDGKTRRIEPGSFPLAHGVSGRVGLLRGYGNAIVPQVAAEFISAFYEALHDVRSDVLMSDPIF
jgi:DNA (cytosine-5)-methyltransferase 1